MIFVNIPQLQTTTEENGVKYKFGVLTEKPHVMYSLLARIRSISLEYQATES